MGHFDHVLFCSNIVVEKMQFMSLGDMSLMGRNMIDAIPGRAVLDPP